jgi:hypothetical protein
MFVVAPDLWHLQKILTEEEKGTKLFVTLQH